jgi:hypothetical protein
MRALASLTRIELVALCDFDSIACSRMGIVHLNQGSSYHLSIAATAALMTGGVGAKLQNCQSMKFWAFRSRRASTVGPAKSGRLFL